MADNSEDFLKKLSVIVEPEEGRRQKPYKDSKGKITIGVGRNLTDVGLSNDEIDYLFINGPGSDCRRVLRACQTISYWAALDETRQLAIADLVFNLGVGTFNTFTQFNTYMGARQYVQAARDLATTLWAHEIGIERVKRIVNALSGGEPGTAGTTAPPKGVPATDAIAQVPKANSAI